MKKIILFAFIGLALVFTSCGKEDAPKDVDNCIKKLNFFNEKFADFNSDGIISKEAISNKEKSEFAQLKKIATEYYELINKVNAQIAEEKERIAKGKKTKDYQGKYQKALDDMRGDLEPVTNQFLSNMEILKSMN